MLKARWSLEEPDPYFLKWRDKKKFFIALGMAAVCAVLAAMAPFLPSVFFVLYTTIFVALAVQEGTAWYDFHMMCSGLTTTLAEEITAEIDRQIIAELRQTMATMGI